MSSFALAVFLLLITPGPGVLSTAGVGSAFGYGAGLRYLVGLFVGTNLVAFAVISGLAAIVLAVPWLRITLLVASAAYLLSLAWRIATSSGRIAFIEAHKAPGVRNGVLLQVINPKAYAVNTTLFTGFAFGAGSLAFETLAKLAIINLIWIPIHLGWLAAGVGLRRLDLPTRVQSAINVAMALAMIGVVALAGWRQYAG